MTAFRRRAGLAWIAGVLVAVAAAPPSAFARTDAKPNLKISALSAKSRSVAAGGRLALTVRTSNTGRGPAGRSTTGLYLSIDARKDRKDQAVGAKTVGRLAARRSASVTLTVTVPRGRSPGAYRLIACADDRGKVRESVERDNCLATRTALTVTAFPFVPGPGGGGPQPTPPAPEPAATLVINAGVVNDNGGTAGPGDFRFSVNGGAEFNGAASGSTVMTVAPGTYLVTQAADSRYASTPADRRCAGTVAAGGTLTCTFGNDDKSGELIIENIVVNDDGKTAEAGHFRFSVNGGAPVGVDNDTGTTLTGKRRITVDAGTATVVEVADARYTTTPSDRTCHAQVPNGGSATCSFTNDDVSVSQQIVAARSSADGPANAPIDGAVVTYAKPGLGADAAGFFVQGIQTGPALFVGVDPGTLTPSPAVGDRVSFVVTSMATLNGLRAASTISGFARTATGVATAPLVQEVSAATDLVSSLSSYESEVLGMQATLASAFFASGPGHQAAVIQTTGIAGDTNLRLRMPSTLVDSLDLAQGCQLTLGAVPMWRSSSQAQPSMYAAGDASGIACPAPRVLGAAAASSTAVNVLFDRRIAVGSVQSNGAQFTIPGLVVTSATVSGDRRVTLTTTAQTSGQSYTVSVASSVADTDGSGVDPAHASATFTA